MTTKKIDWKIARKALLISFSGLATFTGIILLIALGGKVGACIVFGLMLLALLFAITWSIYEHLLTNQIANKIDSMMSNLMKSTSGLPPSPKA